jgi:hypothetical protein
MRTSKILLTALTAALVLGAAVSTASARRIEVSNQSFRAVWTSLEFTGREPFGGTLIVRCPVTLEGSLHSRTLSKVSGQLIGYVTNAQVRGEEPPCEGGTATILSETLPWHIRYDSFRGTLPTITGVRVQLINASFLININPGIPCLFSSTTARPAFGIIEITGGVATKLRADETSQIPRFNAPLNSGFCPAEGSFKGTAELFLQGSTTTRINVRLVQ